MRSHREVQVILGDNKLAYGEVPIRTAEKYVAELSGATNENIVQKHLRGSQWGGGIYGYRLKFWLFYGYRLIFFSYG